MKEINYDLINDLYMGYVNERNPFVQRQKKEDIKSKISPYELLIYSIQYASPFKAFRNIFSLSELFKTLEDMEKRGEDISHITHQPLVIHGIEDIQTISEFSTKETSSEINNFGLRFIGSDIFEYGNIKNIGKKFPYSRVKNLDIGYLEQMIESQRYFKGIPIIITAESIGQLPLNKLKNIENFFDVVGIQIMSKENQDRFSQGEHTPLALRAYKQIRTVVDKEIISKLYISQNADKMHADYQFTAQILDKLSSKIEYDYEASKMPRLSDKSMDASSLVGLLTGKSICKGYSEILRNVLSCVNVDCIDIEGTALNKDTDHAWNQVKLGNTWFNVDLTFARNKICAGKPSGDLFMSDMVFYGNRRTVTFEKGVETNGHSMESTVLIGGHLDVYGRNNKQCREYISPALTSALIKNSRLYDERYKKEGKSSDYKGPIPYTGSSFEKLRSCNKPVVGFKH